MKLIFPALVLFFVSQSVSAALYKKPFTCRGMGEIKGTFFMQKNLLTFEFNSVEDYREGSPWVGHRACVERKCFLHDPSLSKCEKSRDRIVCTGHGMGNGPKLTVEIDLRAREASGTYFNHRAERGASFPNEYNTYAFERISCTGL